MQIIERASVRSRKKDLYYISITKNAKCDGCKACGFGRKNRLTMPALSLIECNAGDTVCVRMPEKQVKASYVYLYLLPLLFMFAGLMIPYAYGEIYMLIGAGVGLAVSVPVVYAVERLFRRRKKYLPVITEKIVAESVFAEKLQSDEFNGETDSEKFSEKISTEENDIHD